MSTNSSRSYPQLMARLMGTGALAFPTWAYTLFFFLIPVAMVFYYSFGYKPDLFNPVATDSLSFDRYQEALSIPVVNALINTLEISISGTLACLLIALPFAYWLATKVSPRRRNLLLALVMVPFWTNFLVRTLGWQIMLAPEGFLSDLLLHLHVLEQPLGILYSRAAVQLGVIYNYLPLMILPLYVALESTGSQLREASRDLGAGRVRTFMDVTLPLAMPGVISGCLLVFIPLNGDYVTASVLGGARGTMVGQLIAQQFTTAQNWALGSALAVILILTTVLVVLLGAVLLKLASWLYHRFSDIHLEVSAS
ncbi:ABC transporter permease [Corynebacterium spheniscorum]|uniref:Spermidine/putrescine transport system permease protein n=1 Tax=Corynebacterium spheniscorum TaxID=185761 RepID=A0A1I2PV37_9CORY|nr:ABC transporter permease [Corynebacterium spheniscorum]KAA8723427.1 ABC transporter permease [Corynebacterium spheniscorum]SFG18979.1 spermidine/putrescine transport system permease protein [Corynebacterium spheniscorum]